MRVVVRQPPSDKAEAAQSRRQAGRAVSAVGLLLCAGALIACSSTASTGTTATSVEPSSAASSPAAATPSGSYPADKQELCQSRDQLKKSIAALTNPALLTGGAAGITTALGQVQTDLGGLVTAGKQDYEAPIAALQSSLKSVETSVSQLANGGGAQNLLAVGSAVTATGSAASTLFTELTAACGS